MQQKDMELQFLSSYEELPWGYRDCIEIWDVFMACSVQLAS